MMNNCKDSLALLLCAQPKLKIVPKNSITYPWGWMLERTERLTKGISNSMYYTVLVCVDGLLQVKTLPDCSLRSPLESPF